MTITKHIRICNQKEIKYSLNCSKTEEKHMYLKLFQFQNRRNQTQWVREKIQ
jgi:hypothetical protein